MPNNKGYIWRGIWFYGEKEVPDIRQGEKFVEDKTLKMHEIVGKDTFIRYKDMNGNWTVTKKEKTNFRCNNNSRGNNFKRNSRFRNNKKN